MMSVSVFQVLITIILEYAKSVTPNCSFPWQGFKVGKITARSAAFQKVFWYNCHLKLLVLLVSVPFILSSFVALVTWHQCNIIVSVPFIYVGNFPPYVNYILAECPGSLLLMNRDKHHFSFSSSFQNADFISTLQFTTKTRITSGLFLIHIYIYSNVLISA